MQTSATKDTIERAPIRVTVTSVHAPGEEKEQAAGARPTAMLARGGTQLRITESFGDGHQMTKEEKLAYDLLKEADIDGSGTLSLTEVYAAMKKTAKLLEAARHLKIILAGTIIFTIVLLVGMVRGTSTLNEAPTPNCRNSP